MTDVVALPSLGTAARAECQSAPAQRSPMPWATMLATMIIAITARIAGGDCDTFDAHRRGRM
jgi:hypothetical protein